MTPTRITELHPVADDPMEYSPGQWAGTIEGDPQPSQERSTWTTVDLRAARHGETAPPPAVLYRNDGNALLYAGKVNAVYGESESMKSWLLLLGAVQEVEAGRHVLWIDFEDDPATVDMRLQQLGVATDTIDAHFHYLRPDEPLIDKAGRISTALADFQEAARSWPHTYAVLDGITEALGLHGFKTNDADDFAAFNRLVPRYLADLGFSVGTVDHVVKDTQTRGKYAIGSQHKRAATSGAGLQVEMTEPFGLGRHGISRISIAKDKPGHLRRHADGKVIAELHLTSDEHTGHINYDLKPPVLATARADGPAWDGPTNCMAAVLHWFQTHPGDEIAKTTMPGHLRAAGAGKYRDDTIYEALERLASDGQIQFRHGPGNRRLYRIDGVEERLGEQF